MKIGSLFAGVGGFDLAAEWLGWETVWHSEINPYATEIFRRRFPASHNVGDIRRWFPVPIIDPTRPDARGERLEGFKQSRPATRSIERVDIVCGGFPCQPVSLAGKGLAQNDDRWLWPEFFRIVRVLRPRFVVVENVPGLLVRGMGDVLRDLSSIGYDAEWETISAADVGAWHLRKRVWIVAYRREIGCDRIGQPERAEQQSTLRNQPNGLCQGGRGTGAEAAPNANSTGQKHTKESDQGRECFAGWYPAPGCGWWDAEPPLGRVADGVPDRVDRIACLGNSIVPAVAVAWAFRRVIELARQGY